MFEKLVLDGFQAGLSWITILRKRAGLPPGFRRLRSEEDRPLERSEEGRADAGRRHRAQPGQDRGDGGARAHHSGSEGERRPRPSSCGASSTAGRSRTRAAAWLKCRPRARFRAPSPRTCAGAAAISSGRRSSTPSCRRPEWSTIISSIVAVTRPAGRWRASQAMSEGATRAPGSGCCRAAAGPHRPVPARHRDRRHRAWPCPRRALERPDQGRGNLFRRPAFALGRGAVFGGAPAPAGKARLTALLHDAPEYVIGDMISPFKAAIGGEYRLIEERLSGRSTSASACPPSRRTI